MQSLEQKLSMSAERSLPVFLNGNARKCFTLLRNVLGDKEYVIAHCHVELEISDLYHEVLKNSKCTPRPVEAMLDIQDTTNALEAAGYQWMVLAGFHTLSRETQKDFAFDLKAAFEESRLKFAIIGSFPEGNPLALYNGDLCGRVTEIRV